MPVRYGDLFEKVCDLDNLRLAAAKASRGRKNHYGVRLFNRDPEGNLLRLRESLLNGTYRTGEYSVFTIYEPKERKIYRLHFYPDRIVHHAIMNVLEPIWVSVFTADTYSCIKGRGIHLAAERLIRALKEDPEGTKYCYKADIRKFYPSIDHGILKWIIRRKIKDERLLALLDEIIDSTERGVPIGNYLSQFFANLYLAYFDHWLKEEQGVRYYFRYADDIVILSGSKTRLHELAGRIREYIAGLKLEIKDNWQIFPVDSRGIDFIGYRFFHGYTLMRKSIKRRFCRKVAELEGRRRPCSGKEFKKALSPWWGWAKHCNSKNLLHKILKGREYDFKRRHKAGRSPKSGERKLALQLQYQEGDLRGHGRRAGTDRLRVRHGRGLERADLCETR